MSVNTTRGVSHTNFPRNTKERYLRTCAAQAREQAKLQAEQEACYQEWQPVQIHQQDAMDKADFNAWLIESVDDGWFEGVTDDGANVYARGQLKRICAEELGHV